MGAGRRRERIKKLSRTSREVGGRRAVPLALSCLYFRFHSCVFFFSFRWACVPCCFMAAVSVLPIPPPPLSAVCAFLSAAFRGAASPVTRGSSLQQQAQAPGSILFSFSLSLSLSFLVGSVAGATGSATLSSSDSSLFAWGKQSSP